MFYRFSNRTGLVALTFSLLYIYALITLIQWDKLNSKFPLQLLMTPLFVSLAITIIWIRDLFTGKDCSVCKKQTYDTLFTDHKLGNFCRLHLLQKYSEDFKKNQFKVVMIEYQTKSGSPSYSTYLYDPVTDIDWGDQKRIVEGLIKTISTKECNVCKVVASILFVPKEGARLIQATEPDFAKKGDYFCKTHALDKIIPSLQNTRHYLTLYLPFKADGLQATYY